MEETSCKFYDTGCHLNWFRDELQKLWLWLWQQMLDAAASVIEAIPMPSWATEGGSLFGSLPGGAGYLLGTLEFDFGLGVLGSAYTVRFLIRRIPLIG